MTSLAPSPPENRAARLCLSRLDADDAPVALADEATTVGGGPRCDLRVPGAKPIGCVITPGPEGPRARRWSDDVLINGEPFAERVLQSGDTLTVHQTDFEVSEFAKKGETPGVEETPTSAKGPAIESPPLVAGAPPEVAEQRPQATGQRQRLASTRHRAKRLIQALRQSRAETKEAWRNASEATSERDIALVTQRTAIAELDEMNDRLISVQHERDDAYNAAASAEASLATLEQRLAELETQCDSAASPSAPVQEGTATEPPPALEAATTDSLNEQAEEQTGDETSGVLLDMFLADDEHHAEDSCVVAQPEAPSVGSEETEPADQAGPRGEEPRALPEAVCESAELEEELENPSIATPQTGEPNLGDAVGGAPDEESLIGEATASATAVDEPSQEPEIEPASFIEQYAHLLPNDDSVVAEAEPYDNATTIAEASPAETPQPTAPAEPAEEEASLDEYMERMMERLRASEQGDEPPPSAPPPAAEASRETAPAAAAPGPESPEPKPIPMRDLSELTSSSAPERNANMDALRELANNSAQSAIRLSKARVKREQIVVRGGVAVVAIGFGLFAMTISQGLGDMAFVAGAAGLIGGALIASHAAIGYLSAGK